MSDEILAMTPEQNRLCGIGVFATELNYGSSIDRAKKLLAAIPKGTQKAIGSAIKRTGISGQAFAAKEIRKEYFISAENFKKYTQTRRSYQHDSNGSSINIEYRGRHIALIKFDTTVSADGRVLARVKRSSARTKFEHVFVQTMPKSGHTGYFERDTTKALPIRELFGPSVPQMMSYNEDVKNAIEKHVAETFNQRLEHEITAILNGWR